MFFGSGSMLADVPTLCLPDHNWRFNTMEKDGPPPGERRRQQPVMGISAELDRM